MYARDEPFCIQKHCVDRHKVQIECIATKNFMQSCIREAVFSVQWFSVGGTSEHPHKGNMN